MKRRLILGTLTILLTVVGCTRLAKSADVPRMTKEELKAMLDNPDLVIIDVRQSMDWANSDSKIEKAVREDPGAVDSWVNKYPKDKPLILYCA